MKQRRATSPNVLLMNLLLKIIAVTMPTLFRWLGRRPAESSSMTAVSTPPAQIGENVLFLLNALYMIYTYVCVLSPDVHKQVRTSIQLTTNRTAAGGRLYSIFTTASVKCTAAPSAPHTLTHIIILVLQGMYREPATEYSPLVSVHMQVHPPSRNTLAM